MEKERANLLGRDAGDPQCLVTGFVTCDDLNGGFGDLEEFCEIFDAESVRLAFNGGGC